jgi:hypothetical protein
LRTPNFLSFIDNVIEHQGTFFGEFHLETDRELDHDLTRVIAFIDFCEDWHARQDSDNPPDASAFEQFEDLIRGQRWTILDAMDNRISVSDAPMFSEGREGEISWVVDS